MAVAPLACSPGCISGCSGTYRIKGDESPAASEFAGETGHRTELAGQIGWGGGCDIPDLAAVAHLWTKSCEYGIDVLEVTQCTAFLMELWEKGIIDEQDSIRWFGEPLRLAWGNHRAAERVIQAIATKDSPLGEILKNGLYEAAKRIEALKGVPVLPYAVYGKAGVPSVGEIRNNPSWATAFAVAARGGDHLKGAVATLERFNRPDISLHEFGSELAAEPFTTTLKGADCARAEARAAVINSLGLCTFLVVLDSLLFPLELFAEGLLASTGVEMTPREIFAAGERTVNLEKAFNSRLGLRREDDRLCERWMNEPVNYGPAGNMKAGDYLELTKDDYYEAQGWDRQTSLQKRVRLKQLDMEDVAEVLAREGAIVD